MGTSTSRASSGGGGAGAAEVGSRRKRFPLETPVGSRRKCFPLGSRRKTKSKSRKFKQSK